MVVGTQAWQGPYMSSLAFSPLGPLLLRLHLSFLPGLTSANHLMSLVSSLSLPETDLCGFFFFFFFSLMLW